MLLSHVKISSFRMKDHLVFHWCLHNKILYYIRTDEIPGFFLLLKNHILIARSEDTILIFHV